MLKIHWHLLDTNAQNYPSFVHSFSPLSDVFAGRIARELWWTGVFPSWHHHHGCPHSHITRGMNNMPVGGRGAESSHPIDMVDRSISFCCISLWVNFSPDSAVFKLLLLNHKLKHLLGLIQPNGCAYFLTRLPWTLLCYQQLKCQNPEMI
jgi:hypothetical protein